MRALAFFRWVALALPLAALSCAEGDPCVGAECGGEAEAVPCEPGTSRCVANTVQVCGADGVYGPRTPCFDGQVCAEGMCTLPGQEGECVPDCAIGDQRCIGAEVSECVLGQGGCLEWGPARACFGGGVCEDGRCLDEACPADCALGDRRCLSLGTWSECVEKSGCPAWGGPQACGAGESCNAGRCQPAGQGCSDACGFAGERACLDQARQQVCVESQGCLRWSDAQPCSQGQRCVGGEGCVAGCEDSCVPGEALCEGAGRRLCEQGADGCLAYGAVQPCGAGEACANGQCEVSCPGACAIGSRRCGDQGPEICIRSEPCPRWAPDTPCPDGAQCVGAGECGLCAPGQVERGACEGACGERTRTCDGNGLWGAWSACQGGGVCSPGATESCGNCGTRRCTAACQWGACEGQGVCSPGAQGDCGQCGTRSCNAMCQWSSCGNGDGTEWQRCNDCGWQFCCPDGDWCECAGQFPSSCNNGRCAADGVCR